MSTTNSAEHVAYHPESTLRGVNQQHLLADPKRSGYMTKSKLTPARVDRLIFSVIGVQKKHRQSKESMAILPLNVDDICTCAWTSHYISKNHNKASFSQPNQGLSKTIQAFEPIVYKNDGKSN